MELNDLLLTMDRVAANLARLDGIWERAKPLLPSSPSRGSSQEYDDLRRSWSSLCRGLLPIDGFTVSDELPDADAAGQAFIEYWEIGEPAFELMNELEQPGRDLDEYRFRLAQARRKAVRERLDDLTMSIDMSIKAVVEGIARSSQETLANERTAEVVEAMSEVERLLGDTLERSGRWGDMHRHMRFSEGHDWHDILEFDWPSVKADIESTALAEADPIPVPDIDLGIAASSRPEGGVSTALNWSALGDDDFERLLFDLLRGLDGYQNVDWLMKTRASDRGRDLGLERVTSDGAGSIRTERVIVQAKHWQSRSIAPADISANLATVSLWEPPVIRALIIATSGRFSADGVAFAENHNNAGKMPFIELWPDSRLETILAQRPDLVAAHHLRD